jgi:hypothetical protein
VKSNFTRENSACRRDALCSLDQYFAGWEKIEIFLGFCLLYAFLVPEWMLLGENLKLLTSQTLRKHRELLTSLESF